MIAGETLDVGPAHEEHQRGHAHHAVSDCGCRVGVDVDLENAHLPLPLAGQLHENRVQLATGMAPLRTKLDEDRLGSLENIFLEGVVGRRRDGCHCQGASLVRWFGSAAGAKSYRLGKELSTQMARLTPSASA